MNGYDLQTAINGSIIYPSRKSRARCDDDPHTPGLKSTVQVFGVFSQDVLGKSCKQSFAMLLLALLREV